MGFYFLLIFCTFFFVWGEIVKFVEEDGVNDLELIG